jgi:hypothetical protein
MTGQHEAKPNLPSHTACAHCFRFPLPMSPTARRKRKREVHQKSRSLPHQKARSCSLKHIPYEDVPHEKVRLPERQKPHGYKEPDYPFKFVPELTSQTA